MMKLILLRTEINFELILLETIRVQCLIIFMIMIITTKVLIYLLAVKRYILREEN